MIIRSDVYRDLLPRSVAAVFYTNESQSACAVEAHQLIVDLYKIDAGDVLLLKHTPGGSPGFAMHDEESARKAVSAASQVGDAMCPGHPNIKLKSKACPATSTTSRDPYWWAAGSVSKSEEGPVADAKIEMITAQR